MAPLTAAAMSSLAFLPLDLLDSTAFVPSALVASTVLTASSPNDGPAAVTNATARTALRIFFTMGFSSVG